MRWPSLVLSFSLSACSGASPLLDGAASPAADVGSALDAPSASATSPIALADAWVAGWYGGGARGTNVYSHVSSPGAPDGYYVEWASDPGSAVFASQSDCSSFSDVLLMRAYDWVPATTHSRPLAEDYYWAIRTGDRFTAVASARDIAVGDTIALLYGSSDAGGDTGHVAWVDAVPEPYVDAPEEAGLTQLSVTIVDSSHGFHYARQADVARQDDRYLGALPSGSDCASDGDCITAFGPSAVCDTWTLSHPVCATTGVGRGRLRLYVDASGSVAGYTWGTSSGSTFYPRPSPLPMPGTVFDGRDIVIGRAAPR